MRNICSVLRLSCLVYLSFLLLKLNFNVIYASNTTDYPVYSFKIPSTYGSGGSDNGQFNYSYGVSVDTSGNIYVADTFNNRIQKFNSSGVFLTKWGSSGIGDGQFNTPFDLSLDSSGNVYVADFVNARIQKFNSSGVFQAKWGSSGTGDGQFNGPSSVAVDSLGNVYVADTNNYRVQKFNSSGVFQAKWGSSGTGDGQFGRSYGIGVDSSGNVYVADSTNNRIQKFNSSGTFLTKWGSSGTGDGEFSYPTAVNIDSSGYVYIADTSNHRIQKFNSSGVFLAKWGSGGTDDGQFNGPQGISTDSFGNVYVADTSNHRIQVFAYVVPTPTPMVFSTAPVPACLNPSPKTAPDLFQIDVGGTKARVYYAPASGDIDRYYIAYSSQNTNAEEHGVEYRQGYSSGVLSFDINLLKPNTQYFFKVRAGNNCATGPWSNILKIHTPPINSYSATYYRLGKPLFKYI